MDNKSVADEIAEMTNVIDKAKQERKKLKAVIRKQEALIYQIKKKNNMLPPPSPYYTFMKQKMFEFNETHPHLTNIERMKMAIQAWSEKIREEN